MPRPTPLLLCILDGWGERDAAPDNAIARAHTPHWDRLKSAYPFGRLMASERFVGLPAGQMGNSEVGHMNIGAGRVVMQDLPRMDAALADGSLAAHPALLGHIATLKATGGVCHVMGLLSDGGVHSHQSHLMGLVAMVARQGVPVAIHAFLDGRDVPPQSAEKYLIQLQDCLDGLEGRAQIVTLSGRYYAMDRDKRWDRVARAYDALVDAKGEPFPDALSCLHHAYGQGITDEFLPPAIIAGAGGYHGMQPGDGLLMVNFRADRVRQLLAALTTPTFDGFARSRVIPFASVLGMAEYGAALAHIPALFPPQEIRQGLGEVLADAGLRQLRIAETEKYAHVTFFFNGGREEVFAGETRIMIPSPAVATYDLQPEMAAAEVTDRILEAIANRSAEVIVVNYANTDMVGHSGNMDAVIRAVETVDACLGRLEAAIRQTGGAMLITADHGNAECLHDPDSGQPHTAHTLNPVPCLIVGEAYAHTSKRLPDGILADIAPTILAMLEIPIPAAMTGRNLLAEAS